MIVKIWWLFQHLLGIDAPGSRVYNFWSGFGGDLFIFGGIITLYKKHNCYYDKCWRIGKHVHEGTPYCNKHKPKYER